MAYGVFWRMEDLVLLGEELVKLVSEFRLYLKPSCDNVWYSNDLSSLIAVSESRFSMPIEETST